MRKHRNARTHWHSRRATRPDGMPNRAAWRSMNPLQQVREYERVVAVWCSIAAALVPGYVPEGGTE